MNIKMTSGQHEKIGRLVAWTRRKIRVDISEREVYFEEREIWWTSLGENIGSEDNGKHDVFVRPVIILKKFSRNLLLAVLVTTQHKQGSWFHHFMFHGGSRWAVLVQVRVLSSKRLVRRMGNIDPEGFRKLRDAIIHLIKTDPSAG